MYTAISSVIGYRYRIYQPKKKNRYPLSVIMYFLVTILYDDGEKIDCKKVENLNIGLANGIGRHLLSIFDYQNIN